MGIVETRPEFYTMRKIANGEGKDRATSSLLCTIGHPKKTIQCPSDQMMVVQDAYAQAQASFAALEAIISAEIDQNSDIQRLIVRAEQARAFAESSVALTISITLEVNAKLVAYQNDAIFKHLKHRSYGTSQYQGTGVFARLDRWLDRSIDYSRAKYDFDMMQALPAEAKSREAEARKSHEQLKAELEASIRMVQTAHNLEAAKYRLHAASEDLRLFQEKMSSNEKKIASFLKKTEAMAERVRVIQKTHSSSSVKTRNLAASLMAMIQATRMLVIDSSTCASRY